MARAQAIKVMAALKNNKSVEVLFGEIMRVVDYLSGIPKGEKGLQGDVGPFGPKGDTGPQGQTGKVGPKGDRGPIGPTGLPGTMGYTGLDGKDGKDGKDGSPDSPNQIVTKVNQATEQIDASKIKNLPAIDRQLPSISLFGGGGNSAKMVFRNGREVYQDIQTIDFLSGFTVTRKAPGYLGLTAAAAGGASGFTKLTATGTVDGNNRVFTFSQTPTYIVSDGVWYEALDSNGGTNWSGTTTVTMTIPPTTAIWGFV